MGSRTSVAILVLMFLAPVLPGQTPPPPAQTVVLDTSGYWRCHFTLRPPVVREGSAVKPVAFSSKWPERETPFPPADWMKPDFDDASWPRGIGAFAFRPSRDVEPKSPLLALECRRAKFRVNDPAAVKGLKLSVAYKGGVVVYLNGTEIARGHLPKDLSGRSTAEGGCATLADDYPLEAQVATDGKPLYIKNYYPEKEELRRVLLRSREIKDVAVPSTLLRKGVNVLAIECHRAAFDPQGVGKESGGRYVCIPWGNCGLDSVRLTAASADGLVPNVARPKGLQVWNSDPLMSDFDLDYGDPNETLRPISIVGTRGGTFSGKLVVGSDSSVKGLRVRVGDLRQIGGTGRIPSTAVTIRYALPWGDEYDDLSRYRLDADRLDALVESPPAEIPVREKKPPRSDPNLKPDPPIRFGAVTAVWVTVRVPDDAVPGDYEGTVDIACVAQPPVALVAERHQWHDFFAQPRAAVPHGETIRVPLTMKVCAWKVPKPADFVTFVEFLQSPDTLALEYGVPPWSDRHFELIERSFKLLGALGCRTIYIPLICETNLGNAESMVRWVKKADGTYKYDFSVMDRYLDVALRNQRRPDMVCLVVWDTFLEGGAYTGYDEYMPKEVKEDRKSHEGKGPEVTVLDEATGKTEKLLLSKQSDPGSRALWAPLLKEVRERLKARGLEDSLMLGFTTDTNPTKEVVLLMKELMPGIPWMKQSHGQAETLYGVPVRSNAFVWEAQFAKDPSLARDHGWNQKRLILFFPRCGMDGMPMVTHRFMAEVNVAGSQRGFGRLGGDFWKVMKNKKGERVGRVSEGRFPRSSWRALNVVSSYLAPGPDGPVATARYEMTREGLQECEARISIEKALIAPASRAKLGDALASRAQALLDERTVDMLRGMSRLSLGIHFTLNAEDRHMWWHAPGALGSWWFVGSGWQDRSVKLFTVAAEVSEALGVK